MVKDLKDFKTGGGNGHRMGLCIDLQRLVHFSAVDLKLLQHVFASKNNKQTNKARIVFASLMSFLVYLKGNNRVDDPIDDGVEYDERLKVPFRQHFQGPNGTSVVMQMTVLLSTT
uniref:UCH domain-containing protein n=1 Tax=Ascaris lumbricoides TaxID=6252 RepID=A0A0M3I4X8_ASCLU